jgi:Tol biopolymer transport system component
MFGSFRVRFSRRTRSVCAIVAAAGLVTAVATPASATFAGPNGRITFARFLPDKDGPGLGGKEIFSAKPDGTDEQRLTFSSEGRNSVFSDWSPNGSQIAFDSDRIDQQGRDDVVQIYVMPWNGESFGLQQLTVGPGFHGDPGYSPGGQRIAIESDWGDFPASEGIWTIPASDPDGVTQAEAQRVTILPAGASFDSEAQYSPDGQWIVFTRFQSCHFQPHGHLAFNPSGCIQAIFKVHPDGTGLTRLTPWGHQNSAPDWSPDGTKIAFDSCDSAKLGCTGDVYVMNADGTGRQRLTDSPPVSDVGHDFANFRFEFANNPVWSPDGKKILYTQWTDGGFPTQLVAINPDGSGQTVVVDGDFFQNKADWGTHP